MGRLGSASHLAVLLCTHQLAAGAHVANDHKNSRYLIGIPSCVFIRNGNRKWNELELELIQTQMAQKPMLRAEVGMRVRCANKASAE
jgi:hypothetical protein